MKSIKIYISFLIVFTFSIVSCEKFDTINDNVNSPENATIDVVLTSAEYNQMNRFGGYGTGMWGVFTQHFAGNHARGVDYDRYILNHGNESGFFTGNYLGPLNDYKYIMETAATQESWHYVGVAKILTAFALGSLTDVFGDIPWTEALDKENERPVYDSQESIYQEIQKLLGEGIADLGKTSLLGLGSNDLIFNGNLDKWKATAHLLMARYLNHLSKKSNYDPDAVLAHVDAAKAAGMNSSDWDFSMPYEGTAQSRNRWYNMWENNAVIASKGMMDMMYGADTLINPRPDPPIAADPRLESYWDNTRFPDIDTIGYKGKPNGFGITNESFSPVGPEGYFGKMDSPILLATYTELLFIEAEAAFVAGEKDRAATAHNAGVTESVNSRVIHPDGLTRVAAYLAAHANENAASITMEKIMTQKWLGMFPMEEETWTDMRRHDFKYPTWVKVPRDENGVPLFQEGQFIRRVLYAQDELDKNESNVPNADIFTKVWWDQ